MIDFIAHELKPLKSTHLRNDVENGKYYIIFILPLKKKAKLREVMLMSEKRKPKSP